MPGACDFVLDLSRLDIEPAKVARRMNAVMRKHGSDYIDNLVTLRMKGPPGITTRTGALARDWVSTVDESAVGSVLTVKTHGIADKYAGLQEYGGTVRPVNSKYLWIPLDANKTPKGVARISPREAIAQGGFYRNGVFFGKPQTKAQGRGIGPHVVPLFALRKSVTVPARLGAGNLFRAMLPWLEVGLEQAMQEAIQ